MQIFVLEWDNGERYEDKCVELLGLYATAEDREAAKERYKPLLGRQHPFGYHGDVGEGAFQEYDLTVGEDLVKSRLISPRQR